MITTRQVRTDIIYILRPIFHEGVAKLLLGSYLRFRLYGAYVGLELLGNSLIVTFEVLGFLVYSSFFSSTKDKGIARKSDFHRSTRSSVRFNAACKYL